MSIGGPILAAYAFLQNEGFFANVKTVAELGSIEYEIKAAEHEAVFERFFRRAGAAVPNGRNPETGWYKGWGREVYENLGYEYISFDIDGRFGSRVFDLNHDRVPDALRGWSDFTTNLGTIEHVFDQVNSFRVVHDLTKIGGLMFHQVPMNNYVHHGMYQYNPHLFSSVAEYNDYTVLGQWVSSADPSFWLPSNVKSSFLRASGIVITLMRRNGSGDFVTPLQIDTPMHVHPSAINRYNADSFARHDPTVPKYDRAFKVDFPTLESRILSMDEVAADETFELLAEGGPHSPRGRYILAKKELRQMEKLLRRKDKQLENLERSITGASENNGFEPDGHGPSTIRRSVKQFVSKQAIRIAKRLA